MSGYRVTSCRPDAVRPAGPLDRRAAVLALVSRTGTDGATVAGIVARLAPGEVAEIPAAGAQPAGLAPRLYWPATVERLPTEVPPHARLDGYGPTDPAWSDRCRRYARRRWAVEHLAARNVYGPLPVHGPATAPGYCRHGHLPYSCAACIDAPRFGWDAARVERGGIR